MGSLNYFALSHAKPAMILTGSDQSMFELEPKLTQDVGKDICSSPKAEQADKTFKSFQEGVTRCTYFSLGLWGGGEVRLPLLTQWESFPLAGKKDCSECTGAQQ